MPKAGCRRNCRNSSTRLLFTSWTARKGRPICGCFPSPSYSMGLFWEKGRHVQKKKLSSALQPMRWPKERSRIRQRIPDPPSKSLCDVRFRQISGHSDIHSSSGMPASMSILQSELHHRTTVGIGDRRGDRQDHFLLACRIQTQGQVQVAFYGGSFTCLPMDRQARCLKPSGRICKRRCSWPPAFHTA